MKKTRKAFYSCQKNPKEDARFIEEDYPFLEQRHTLKVFEEYNLRLTQRLGKMAIL